MRLVWWLLCGCNYSFRGGAPLPVVPVVAGFCSRGAAAVPGWLALHSCSLRRFTRKLNPSLDKSTSLLVVLVDPSNYAVDCWSGARPLDGFLDLHLCFFCSCLTTPPLNLSYLFASVVLCGGWWYATFFSCVNFYISYNCRGVGRSVVLVGF